MYDNHTTQELRDALALRDEQNASQRQMLESARSELRLEKQRVADLIREKTALEVDLEKARTDHCADAAKISARFRDEAVERGWCEEAVQVIESLNEDLVVPLTTPEREYVVEATATVYVRRIVRAIDKDAARHVMDTEWREAVSETDFFEQIVYGQADVQHSSDWEVEEGD